jgi:predicted DNA-binding protein
MRNNLDKIRITKETKERIKKMAEKNGLKQVTILEYLLSGKIPLEDLKQI